MSNESAETQMARIDERLKSMMIELQAAKDGRKDQYEKMEDIGRQITSMDGRMKNVETSLAKSAPTIEEFITIKHKVVGAGAAGKYLYAGAGILIGILAASREFLISWLGGK